MIDLFEDSEFFDIDSAQDLVTECLTKITSFKRELAPDTSLLRISLEGYDATNTLGRTGLWKENGATHIEISLNKYIMKIGLEDLFINTFVHEYCHYLAHVEMLKDSRVTFDKELIFASPEVEAYYLANDGHGECWLRYADELSTALRLKYKVTAHPQKPESEIYRFANKNEVVFTVECPNNDLNPLEIYEKDPANIFEYEPELVKLIAAIASRHAVCPNCGTELKLHFYQADYEPKLIDAMKQGLRELMLRAILGRL